MIKNCKRCGKEMPQNSKNNLCDHCQNEKNGKIRKTGSAILTVTGVVVSTALYVVTKGKSGTPKV